MHDGISFLKQPCRVGIITSTLWVTTVTLSNRNSSLLKEEFKVIIFIGEESEDLRSKELAHNHTDVDNMMTVIRLSLSFLSPLP